MNDKVRSLLMLMVGAYIAFLGGDLVYGVIKGTSEQPTMFAIIGTVFIVLGIAVVLFNIKRTKEIEQRLAEEADEEALDEEKEPENEK